jgi:hypothetical protein
LPQTADSGVESQCTIFSYEDLNLPQVKTLDVRHGGAAVARKVLDLARQLAVRALGDQKQ